VLALRLADSAVDSGTAEGGAGAGGGWLTVWRLAAHPTLKTVETTRTARRACRADVTV